MLSLSNGELRDDHIADQSCPLYPWVRDPAAAPFPWPSARVPMMSAGHSDWCRI